MDKIKINREVPSSIRANFLDKQFGDLRVIGFGGRKLGYTYWVCMCSCGDIDEYLAANLTSGRSQKCVRCGHLSRRIHPQTESEQTPTWHAWLNARMKDTLCEDWQDNYALFLKEMGEKPVGSWLKRRDPKKPHSKSNSLWWTPQKTRMQRILEIAQMAEEVGTPLSAQEISKLRKVSRQAISQRMRALQLKVEEKRAIRKQNADD